MKKKNETNVAKKELVTATRLKLLRVQHDLTQVELSKELGVSQQTYSNFEKGEGRLDVNLLKKICNFYGVSADYILGLDENQKRAAEVKKLSELSMIQMLAENNK